MNVFSKILTRIFRKLIKLLLQPIRVLCFHQVSEKLDTNFYCKPDWISLSDFKEKIQCLKNEGYLFISLEEAYHHIKHDLIRTRKYAVLTADDGLKCQLDIIPWLEDNNIPLTMFLNVETLSGNKCNEPIKQFFNLTSVEQEKEHAILFATADDIVSSKSKILSYGLHGVDHRAATAMTKAEYREKVVECKRSINNIVQTIPFYAYTYGIRTDDHDNIIHNEKLKVVLALKPLKLADFF